MNCEQDNNLFLQYVSSGHFEEAYQMIRTDTRHEAVFTLLYEMAYDDENITPHAFCYYVYSKTGDVQWLKDCITILCVGVSGIEGAYALALHYARELYQKTHGIDALGWMLFLYSLPEGLLSDDEALCIAQKALALDPDYKKAKEILDRVRRKNSMPDAQPGNCGDSQ